MQPVTADINQLARRGKAPPVSLRGKQLRGKTELWQPNEQDQHCHQDFFHSSLHFRF